MKNLLFEWNGNLITVDYLKGLFKNEEVLSGVDLEEFIIENRLTCENVWVADIHKLVEEYKQSHHN